MLISVIAPCRNEAGSVERFVAAALAQRLEPGHELELLIAEGRSDDGTREILERVAAADARVRVLDNPRGLTAAGLNIAIRQARGAVVARMDLHTDYAPDYLAECIRALVASGADNAGGPWVPRGEGRVGEAVALAFACPWVSGGGKAHDAGYEGEVDTVYLGCWRREAFERFGMFDEDLVRAQDSEFNLRIWRRGGRVWQTPRARSWYRPRNRLRDLFRQYAQYGYWKVATLKKHRLPASWRQLVPGAFVGGMLALGALGVLDPRWFALAGLLAAFYLGGCAAAAFALCRRSGRWDLAPLLPPVFAAFHFGFGYGYWRGLLDFFVLRRGARPAFGRLTRPSEPARKPRAA